MNHQQRTSPRAEHRQRENLRINESVSLAEKFRDLKSLTVDLLYLDPEGLTRTSQIKYTVNLGHAKSAFCFNCQNNECVGGDFDLSQALSKAIGGREESVSGETRCQGWRNKATIGQVHCRNLLRYKLSLGY